MEQSIAHWLIKEGALVYLLPTLPEGAPYSLTEIVEDLDGLVLQGGSDVAPQSYGEVPLRPEWAGDFVRDQYEIQLVREFHTQNKPILGVCRGLQLLNVAYGGTLYQDIEAQCPGTLKHRNWDIYDLNRHRVEVLAGTALDQILGAGGSHLGSKMINSVHHQAIRQLSSEFEVLARSTKDAIIEAIRHRAEDRWIWAVQWHPEFDTETARILAPGEELLPSVPLLREFFQQCSIRKS